MTKDQKIIRAKVGLLQLAKHLGNVSQACKMMGYSRESFCRFKELYETGGELALEELTRRKPILKNRTPAAVEAVILTLSLDQPAFGQLCIANEVRKLAHSISPAGVRSVWQRRTMAVTVERLTAIALGELHASHLEQKGAVQGASGSFLARLATPRYAV
jgi:hypothetical protein